MLEVEKRRRKKPELKEMTSDEVEDVQRSGQDANSYYTAEDQGADCNVGTCQ